MSEAIRTTGRAGIVAATVAVVALAALLAGCETTATRTVDGVTVPVPAPGATAERDPAKRARIRIELAASYYQKGQFTVAIEETRKAIELAPELGVGYGLLGLIYMDLGDRGQAESNFLRALRTEPDDADLANNYGWFLCRTGRERESIEYFLRAAQNRLYATPGKPLQNAGLCLLQVGDAAAAEPHLRRSFELDAGNPVTQFHLARAYLKLAQVDRAGFYYELLGKLGEPGAEVLWLGVRIARARGDRRAEAALGEELRRRFPASREAGLLRQERFDD